MAEFEFELVLVSVSVAVSVALLADGVLEAGLDVWGWVRVVAVSVGWEGSVVESV